MNQLKKKRWTIFINKSKTCFYVVIYLLIFYEIIFSQFLSNTKKKKTLPYRKQEVFEILIDIAVVLIQYSDYTV